MKTFTSFYKTDNHFPVYSQDSLCFDIETTGLQSRNALVYLIGCAHYIGNYEWKICQWFAENPDEEAAILAAFSQYASGFRQFIHYNGTRFDIPFLTHRFQLYSMDSFFDQRQQMDLYCQYKPFKKLLSLPDLKQKTLENYIGLSRTDTLSGKECINFYRNLIKYRDLSYSEPLLLHNKEDLLGLIALGRLQSIQNLMSGEYRLLDAKMEQNCLLGHLKLKYPIPKPLSFKTAQLEFTAENCIVSLCFPIQNGTLKNYYADYQNYYYLPNEDMAIHKSVGIYTDTQRRKKATPETCYTRFTPNSDFTDDKSQVESYFRHNLSVFLEQYCNRK